MPAVEGFGLRAGAAPEDAHKAGLAELNRLHEEHRNISLNIKDDAAEQGPETIAGSVARAEVEGEQEKPNDLLPEEIIAGADAAIERRERDATMDDEGEGGMQVRNSLNRS